MIFMEAMKLSSEASEPYRNAGSGEAPLGTLAFPPPPPFLVSLLIQFWCVRKKRIELRSAS